MKNLILSFFVALFSIVSGFAVTDGFTYEAKNGLTVTNLWIDALYHNPDGLNALPWTVDNQQSKARTACFGKYQGNDVILVGYSKNMLVDGASDDYAHIVIMDFLTGEVIKTQQITCDGQPIKGLLCANQVGCDQFGHVWLMGYAASLYSADTGKKTCNLYNVNLVDGTATIAAALEVDDDCVDQIGAGGTRVDYWDAVGDITRENAPCTVMAAISSGSSTWILAWTAEQGSDEFVGGMDGYMAREMEKTYPSGVDDWGTNSYVRIVLDEDYSNNLFYADGFTTCASLYTNSGTMVEGGNFSYATDLAPATGTNGIGEFSLAGRDFIVYSTNQYVSPGFCSVRVCELGDNMSFDGMESYWELPTDGLGNQSDGGLRIHSIDTKHVVDASGHEGVYILTYKAANGIGVYYIAEDGFNIEDTELPKIFNSTMGNALGIGPDSTADMVPTIHSFGNATGVQFDLTLPQGLELTDVKVSGSNGERSALETSFAKIGNGDYRVLLYTTDGSDFGDIMLGFSFASDSTLKPGQIRCHNIILSVDGKGTSLPDEIVYVSGYDVVLDDVVLNVRESLTLPAPIGDIDGVTYTWSTIEPAGFATLSSTGEVTGVKAGKGTYSVKVKDTNIGVEKTYTGNIEVLAVLWGDVDGDGVINVSDLVAMIDYILEQGDPSSFDERVADIDGNGEINIVDITALIKLILEHQNDATTEQMRALSISNHSELSFSDCTLQNDGTYAIGLNISAAKLYTAMQTDIVLPEKLKVVSVKAGAELSGHTMVYSISELNVLRVMFYSMTLAEMPADSENTVVDLVLEGTIKSGDVIMAANSLACDTDANPYPLGDTLRVLGTSGVSEVKDYNYRAIGVEGGIELDAPTAMKVVIYDMSGRTIATPEAPDRVNVERGVYFVTFDGDAPLKVLVR